MEINDNLMLKQGELVDAIGVAALNVTPAHWQDIKWKIKIMTSDNGDEQLDFELISQEGHQDQIQLSQALIDKSIELYNVCAQNKSEWLEATIRVYRDKNSEQWKCVASYKYE